jgi:hypothetical protein
MSGQHSIPMPRVFEQHRPEGMSLVETVLWEGRSAAALAAYDRLTGPSADTMSPAALDALCLLDAGQAAQSHIERVAATAYMQGVLTRMLSVEGAMAGRALVASVKAHEAAGGMLS